MRDYINSDKKGMVGQKIPEEKYFVPRYSWSKPTFNMDNSKKLDYICLFAEKNVRPDLNLVKIHLKKKDIAPDPSKYAYQKKWSHVGPFDDPKRGKWLKNERVTSTHQVIKDAKRTKTPAPNAYKPRRQDRIIGTIKTEEPTSLMVEAARVKGKETPGHKYKINRVSLSLSPLLTTNAFTGTHRGESLSHAVLSTYEG